MVGEEGEGGEEEWAVHCRWMVGKSCRGARVVMFSMSRPLFVYIPINRDAALANYKSLITTTILTFACVQTPE